MKSSIAFILVFFIVTIATFPLSNFITVDTEYGPVKGVTTLSILGRNFVRFQGIPYMRPPIGKLRFRDAQPPDNWTSEFDATKQPPSYLQQSFMTQKVQGQEDAGVINVYTPYVSPKALLPVMVFIHGGGFQVKVLKQKIVSTLIFDSRKVLAALKTSGLIISCSKMLFS